MDAESIYHFLFETYTGLGILVASCLVISLILCVIMERKTRSVYKDRGPKTEDDEWSLFDDDDDDGAADDDEADDSGKANNGNSGGSKQIAAKGKSSKAAATKKAEEEKKPEIKKATVRRAK